MPKDSMSLHNAVMYLQNVLVAIQMEINCKVRYSLFYKFIARTNILQMQKDYEEAQVMSRMHHTEGEEEGDKPEEGEGDSSKYPLPDFPLTQAALKEYHKEI